MRDGQGASGRSRARFVRACGVLPAFVGLGALVGWAFDLPVLTTFGTGLLPVAPSTAALLLLSGVALAGDPDGRGPGVSRRASASTWGIVAVLACIFLAAATVGYRIEAEHLGFPANCTPPGPPLGHMVPVTAVTFLVLAAAFLLSSGVPAASQASWRRRGAWIGAWSVVAFYLVLLVVFSYGFLVAVSGPVLPPALGTVFGFVLLGTGLALRAAPGAGAGKPVPSVARPGVPGVGAVATVFALLALGIVVAGFVFFRGAEERYRGSVERQLEFEASLRAEALERWRGERLADADLLRTNPAFVALCRRVLRDPPDEEARFLLGAWLDGLQRGRGYLWAALLDSQGRARLSSPPSAGPGEGAPGLPFLAAIAAGNAAMLDFHRDVPGGPVHLSVMAAVPGVEPSGKPALVLLAIDPSARVLPFLAEHPGSAGSHGASLVRREGDVADVFESLGTPDGGRVLVRRAPPVSSDAVEARAARGEQGVVMGADANGTAVLAVLHPVRGSPWVLVVRSPLAEVFSASRTRLWGTVFVVLLLVAGAGAGVSALWKREESHLLHERFASDERFRKVFETSPDAVTLTRVEDGVLVAANEGFRRILEYSGEEVLGRVAAELGFWRNPGEREALVDELRRTGLVENLESTFVTRSGNEIVCLLSASFVELDGRPHVLILSRDITGRKKAEEELRVEQERLDLAVTATGLGLYDWNVRSGAVLFGDRWAAMFGYRVDELAPHFSTWLERVHPDDLPASRKAAEDAFRDGTPYSCEYRMRHRDGSWRWILDQGRIVTRDEQGEVIRFVGANLDITERRQAAERIRGMNEELERRVAERTVQLASSVRELEAFSYSLAHDLKTPLRAIAGYATLLEKDQGARLDDEGRSWLAKVRSGAVTMGQLIEELLEYSRLDRREMRAERVDVDAVVRAVVASRDEEIRSKGGVVRIVPGGTQATADPVGLELALCHLLDNALKFHVPGKSAEVTVTTSNPAGRAVVVVRDEGIGFDLKYHDRIFEIFQRLGRLEEYPGTGVGLALVRRVVQRMGGSVRAESAPGAGATFTIELPS